MSFSQERCVGAILAEPLLTLPVHTFFAVALFFSLTRSVRLAMLEIGSLLCGLHLGPPLREEGSHNSCSLTWTLQATLFYNMTNNSTQNSREKIKSFTFPLPLISLRLRLYFYFSLNYCLTACSMVGNIFIRKLSFFSRKNILNISWANRGPFTVLFRMLANLELKLFLSISRRIL